ncbi:MAG: class II aldolase/adducin family protein, partial [Anaerococcus obesiensis]
MLEDIKERVYKANLLLPKYDLVKFTWGNVSEITPDRKYVVIKPSGVDYDSMKASDMVVVDLDGNIVEGNLKPSSDTPTHIELYKKYKEI